MKAEQLNVMSFDEIKDALKYSGEYYRPSNTKFYRVSDICTIIVYVDRYQNEGGLNSEACLTHNETAEKIYKEIFDMLKQRKFKCSECDYEVSYIQRIVTNFPELLRCVECRAILTEIPELSKEEEETY